MAGGTFGGGAGVAGNPYLVEDAQDMNAVRNNKTAHYKQTVDIDLSIYSNWIPIGTATSSSTRFKGTFEGNGKNIINLVTNGTSAFSLFGWCELANFKNINIINASITGTSQLGVLAGVCLNCEINNCHVSGSVTGTHQIGGLIGESNGGSIFKKCSSSVNVTSSTQQAGGLIGALKTSPLLEVVDCFSTGNVIGSLKIGGFIGVSESTGKIERCYSTGDVSGTQQTGGVIGFLSVVSTLKDCFYLGKKITRKTSGGLYTTFGDIYGESTGSTTVINCFSLDTLEFTEV